MRHSLKSGILPALAASAAVIALSYGAARADTITNIDLTSYFNGNWSSAINGSVVAAGAESGTGNAGTGLTFSDPTGQYVAVSSSQVISFTPVALTGNSVVNGLFNQFFGPTGATITFTNSANQTDTFSLVSNATIRDYNNDGFNNFLTGTGTGVTAENWWSTQDGSSNGNGQPSQRLDAQIFTLPASWAGTDLISVDITNSGGGDTVLSALQVDAKTPTPTSPVPEPASLALLATGLIGLGLVRRPRRSV